MSTQTFRVINTRRLPSSDAILLYIKDDGIENPTADIILLDIWDINQQQEVSLLPKWPNLPIALWRDTWYKYSFMPSLIDQRIILVPIEPEAEPKITSSK